MSEHTKIAKLIKAEYQVAKKKFETDETDHFWFGRYTVLKELLWFVEINHLNINDAMNDAVCASSSKSSEMN